MIPTQKKSCTKCKTEKLLDEFYRNGQDYWCKGCRGAANREWKRKNPERKRELDRQSAQRQFLREKLAVIEAYGGRCSCDGCDVSDPHFLTVEHKHGVPLRKIRRAGYPDGFTIMCWNCNCARAYFGFCPHQPHTDEQRRYPRGE